MKFTASVAQLMILSAFIIPGLVALVTKWNAHPVVKQLTLVLLSIVATVVANLVADTSYDALEILGQIGLQFILATAAFFGLDKVVYLPVAKSTANVGVGGTKQVA